MADLCSLQKDPNGPRGYSSGSVNQLLDIVSDYLAKGIEKYEETQDITIARLYVAKALQEIGNKYVKKLNENQKSCDYVKII